MAASLAHCCVDCSLVVYDLAVAVAVLVQPVSHIQVIARLLLIQPPHQLALRRCGGRAGSG